MTTENTTGSAEKYEPVHQFKPDKTAALWYPLILVMIPTGLTSGVIAVASLMAGSPLGALLTVLFGCAVVFLSWLHLKARLRKSVFTLYEDRLVAKTGGLLSDSTNELAVRNVTYVAYQLPFLERIFFKTGTIRIESAGSGGCEIRMFHLKDPLEALEPVFETLRKNDFRMKLGTPVQEHRVAGAGKVIDLIGQFVSFVFLFFLFTAEAFSKGDLDAVTAAIIFSIGAVICFGIMGVRYLDLNSRRYRLYMDAVDFEEGFFSYVKVFIPAENISDTKTDVGIIGRIFGYCDVKVSCQGAGKEITFSYLSDGTRLIQGLDATVEEMRHKGEAAQTVEHSSGDSAGESAAAGAEAGSPLSSARKAPASVRGEDKFTGDREYKKSFKQNMVRALAPAGAILACLIAVVIGVGAIMLVAGTDVEDVIAMAVGISVLGVVIILAASVSSVISALFTQYEVKEDSVASSFSFIVKKNLEFSFDKVTSVVLSKNPLDWVLGTVSLKFTSIGSSTPLHVLHQKRSDLDEKKILGKCGIYESDALYTLKSEWTFGSFITAPGTIGAVGLFGIAAIIAGVIIHDSMNVSDALMADGVVLLGLGIFTAMVAVWTAVCARYYALSLSADHFLGKAGVFFQTETNVPYRYVKGTRVVHHFLSSPAIVYVDIAGEIFVGQGQNGQQIIVSNNYGIPYVTDGNRFVDCLNRIVSTKRHERNAQAIIEATLSEEKCSSGPFRPEVVQEFIPNQTQVMIFKMLGVVIVFGATAIGMIAGGLPLVGALVGAFVMLPLLVLSFLQARALRYQVCELEAAMEWGVLFKERKTVCYHQFDFVRNEQGAINKIFGTGDINIHTTGSSMVEISFSALNNYNEFEQILKRQY